MFHLISNNIDYEVLIQGIMKFKKSSKSYSYNK
jgi:hypothetical protein